MLVGADRIAANGDTANKIGTFALSLAAAHAGVPFLVVAPETTVDPGTPTGSHIPIEDRGAAEVCSFHGVPHHSGRHHRDQPGLRRHPGRADHRDRHRTAHRAPARSPGAVPSAPYPYRALDEEEA